MKLSSINACSKKKIGLYQDKYKIFFTISKKELDADVIAYAMQASEGRVVIHLPSGDVLADILQTRNRNALYFLLGFDKNPGVRSLSDVSVTFVLKFSYFDRLHRALENLSQDLINRLMPSNPCQFSTMVSDEDVPPPIKCVIDIVRLEYSQRRALASIMSCEANKAPVLVIGSFGTGKTQLLARAAYQILREDRNNKILICAHHQHSADTFMTNYFFKMIKSGWYSGKVIRLVPSRSYNAPTDCKRYYATFEHLCFDNLEKISIIVTTFLTSLHLIDVVPKGFFTHILLDEGAQSREPESVAPLCFADIDTKIVIAGDHKQVSAQKNKLNLLCNI